MQSAAVKWLNKRLVYGLYLLTKRDNNS